MKMGKLDSLGSKRAEGRLQRCARILRAGEELRDGERRVAQQTLGKARGEPIKVDAVAAPQNNGRAVGEAIGETKTG